MVGGMRSSSERIRALAASVFAAGSTFGGVGVGERECVRAGAHAARACGVPGRPCASERPAGRRRRPAASGGPSRPAASRRAGRAPRPPARPLPRFPRARGAPGPPLRPPLSLQRASAARGPAAAAAPRRPARRRRRRRPGRARRRCRWRCGRRRWRGACRGRRRRRRRGPRRRTRRPARGRPPGPPSLAPRPREGPEAATRRVRRQDAGCTWGLRLDDLARRTPQRLNKGGAGFCWCSNASVLGHRRSGQRRCRRIAAAGRTACPCAGAHTCKPIASTRERTALTPCPALPPLHGVQPGLAGRPSPNAGWAGARRAARAPGTRRLGREHRGTLAWPAGGGRRPTAGLERAAGSAGAHAGHARWVSPADPDGKASSEPPRPPN
jgi:hypothetical protein